MFTHFLTTGGKGIEFQVSPYTVKVNVDGEVAKSFCEKNPRLVMIIVIVIVLVIAVIMVAVIIAGVLPKILS